ncbi:hypothetical protein Tiera_048 [Polaromonas phage Tiera]|nr:hypothetical protein Tiera_048 [Polaromonas phage Tiera]
MSNPNTKAALQILGNTMIVDKDKIMPENIKRDRRGSLNSTAQKQKLSPEQSMKAAIEARKASFKVGAK